MDKKRIEEISIILGIIADRSDFEDAGIKSLLKGYADEFYKFSKE